jgi:uncharacterized protein YkwD
VLRGRRLVFTALSAATLALAAPAAASARCDHGEISPSDPAFLEFAPSAAVCLLNEQRTARGLDPLTVGSMSLSDPAVSHSQDMVARQFFDHVNPDGIDFVERLRTYWEGYSYVVGENLYTGQGYSGSVDVAVNAWMHSDGHRANILDPRFKEIGVGIVRGFAGDRYASGATYTTTFGARATRTQPPPTPTPTPTPWEPPPSSGTPDSAPTESTPDSGAASNAGSPSNPGAPQTTAPATSPSAPVGGSPIPVVGSPGTGEAPVTPTDKGPSKVTKPISAARLKVLRLRCVKQTRQARRSRTRAARAKARKSCLAYRAAKRVGTAKR